MNSDIEDSVSPEEQERVREVLKASCFGPEDFSVWNVLDLRETCRLAGLPCLKLRRELIEGLWSFCQENASKEHQERLNSVEASEKNSRLRRLCLKYQVLQRL